jgi:Cu+-exporting ATPase
MAATSSATGFTTTILVKNIHCSSCITHIQQVLGSFAIPASKIRVSILEQDILIRDTAPEAGYSLCKALVEAAFEVHSAYTVDQSGNVVSELKIVSDQRGWLDTATGLCLPTQSTTPSFRELSNMAPGLAEKRHLENCAACKAERKQSAENASRLNSSGKDGYSMVIGSSGDGATSLPTNIGTLPSLQDGVSADRIHTEMNMEEGSYKTIVSISGMTCAACPNAITRGLRELPFVEDLNITLMTNGGEVTFRGRKNLESILEKIDDLGYDCTVIETMMIGEVEKSAETSSPGSRRTLKLMVDGIFCDHCSPRIVKALENRFAGLVELNKLPTTKDPIMALTYQPDLPSLSVRTIISTVNSTHEALQTKVYHPPSIEDRSRSMQVHERRRMLMRLLLSFLVAIPTFLIGVVWMSLVSSMNPVKVYLSSPVWSGNVTRAEWALLILATPVMFFAADIFHIRAIKEIRALWRRGSTVPVLQRFIRFGSMNLLISAGTSVAYFSSLGLLIMGASAPVTDPDNGTYFDSVVFLTFFILIGRNLEAYSKSKTGDAVAMLAGMRPETALLVVQSDRNTVPVDKQERSSLQLTNTEVVSVDLLEVGDRVIVPHGSSPPADGYVLVGSTKFDESSLTGESRSVPKAPGETVFMGTINTGNPVTIEVSKIGGTSMLDEIVSVVREGQTKRAPIERLADILTGYFVPVITALAIITFLVWLILGQSGVLDRRYIVSQSGGWAFWSLEFAIAVFVVACPCGIGLAAPTALFVGGGLAAKHGILVRGGGEAFQEAGDLDAIVFDKTGTLTEGSTLSVTDSEVFIEPAEEMRIWTIVKCLEEQSSHPIASAILDFVSTRPGATTIVERISEESGRGIRGVIRTTLTESDATDIHEAVLGSQLMIASLEPSPPQFSYFVSQTLSRWQTEAKSTAILATRRLDGFSSEAYDNDPAQARAKSAWTISAILATTDPVRPSALLTVQTLQARGLAVYMLSGDNQATALAVGTSLGIPAANIFAGLLPTEKAKKIEWLQKYAPKRTQNTKWLQKTGLFRQNVDRKAKIAFVGDGINDTPALQVADVSVSLSTGSPIALSSSSFILLTSSLMAIPLLLDLSSRVFRRIKFNFAWALGYNICLVPIAAGILFKIESGGFRLGPVWASVAMACSSVSVVLSSLALRWEGDWKFWKKNGKRRSREEPEGAREDIVNGVSG